jgi:hypothetical protein
MIFHEVVAVKNHFIFIAVFEQQIVI